MSSGACSPESAAPCGASLPLIRLSPHHLKAASRRRLPTFASLLNGYAGNVSASPLFRFGEAAQLFQQRQRLFYTLLHGGDCMVSSDEKEERKPPARSRIIVVLLLTLTVIAALTGLALLPFNAAQDAAPAANPPIARPDPGCGGHGIVRQAGLHKLPPCGWEGRRRPRTGPERYGNAQS